MKNKMMYGALWTLMSIVSFLNGSDSHDAQRKYAESVAKYYEVAHQQGGIDSRFPRLKGTGIDLKSFNPKLYVRPLQASLIPKLLEKFPDKQKDVMADDLKKSIAFFSKNFEFNYGAFSDDEYMWLVYKAESDEEQKFLLRSKNPREIRFHFAYADEGRKDSLDGFEFPNFDLKNPNFVVLKFGIDDIVMDASYVREELRLTLRFVPHFFWNGIDDAAKIPEDLRKIIEIAHAALSSQPTASDDNQPLSELFGQLSILGA